MLDIRLMTESDISQVVAIEEESFSTPWSEKSFRDSLKNKDTLFLIACEDNVIKGYCGMYISFDEGSITNIAVQPKFRKEGIASSIIIELLKASYIRNVTKIFLEVRVSNEVAIKLYEKFGFKKVGVRKNFYERPKEDALIMMKEI